MASCNMHVCVDACMRFWMDVWMDVSTNGRRVVRAHGNMDVWMYGGDGCKDWMD